MYIQLLSVASLMTGVRAAVSAPHVVAPPSRPARRSCAPHTKLLPRNAEYRTHCDGDTPTGGDPKWPCFTFWSDYLGDVVASTDDPKADPDKDIFLVKNGFLEDFTIRDPTKPFSLTWDGQATLSYKGYKKESGCYTIQLSRQRDTNLRIWVSDEDNKERKVDTLHHENPDPVEICTKWAHFHVKYDGLEW
ncbi:checkpoint kinase [Moesziomyces antarcticus T-34]|uniref:Checkpoint kinase n=1 Tax=Pseudozyma antarctica (strain T-34) TaxID=1151754 RepID=M9M492_PSEA3|nr:checkpoint kinase [Moesziomyces antarcticus T-34]